MKKKIVKQISFLLIILTIATMAIGCKSKDKDKYVTLTVFGYEDDITVEGLSFGSDAKNNKNYFGNIINKTDVTYINGYMSVIVGSEKSDEPNTYKYNINKTTLKKHDIVGVQITPKTKKENPVYTLKDKERTLSAGGSFESVTFFQDDNIIEGELGAEQGTIFLKNTFTKNKDTLDITINGILKDANNISLSFIDAIGDQNEYYSFLLDCIPQNLTIVFNGVEVYDSTIKGDTETNVRQIKIIPNKDYSSAKVEII